MGARHFLIALLFLLCSLSVAACEQRPRGSKPQWGRLANPGFDNQRIKTTLFFAGQARDCSVRYGGVKAAPNLKLYTVHPRDNCHLNWSVSPKNRAFAVTAMLDAGINVATMSTWGESFLPPKVGWPIEAPMQVAPQANDELYEAVGKRLLIMPLIESRGDWAFRDEFPRSTDGRIAPGTVSQIKDLIKRHLKNLKHPEWANRWARVYDRNGTPRYPVVIIHASSTRLRPNDHKAFAAGFDLLAQEVFKETKGVKVGFFLDVLPSLRNAPGRFKANPEVTGPLLRTTDAVLGIQCFLPEVWLGKRAEAGRINWKRDFAQGWFQSGVPFLMDVSPGYDNHLVFPKNQLKYGFTPAWQNALTKMVGDFGRNGVVYNSWNGYTEGMAAVPTKEHKEVYYRWLKNLNASPPIVGK